MDYIVHIIKQILTINGINDSSKKIREIICSDPDFPSALSVIRTLYYYGLLANAYKADIYSLRKEKKTRIIHCTNGAGHFFLVKDISSNTIKLYEGKEHIIEIASFVKWWDGIVIVIDGKEERLTFKGTKHNVLNLLWIAILIILSFAVCGNLLSITQMTINFVGLFLSTVLYIKYTFHNIRVPFCYKGRYFNCDAVSQYHPFSINIPFGLPFMGMSFFIFDSISILYNAPQNILYIANIIGALCSIYLLGYQVFYIQKYCFFCIIISFCVILKMLLLFMTCEMQPVITLQMYIYSLFNVILALTLSHVICEYLKSKNELNEVVINALSFKRLPSLFFKQLRAQPVIELPQQASLSFGRGGIRIDTIVELGCHHCKKVIDNLIPILEKYKDIITWNVYIHISTQRDKEESRIVLELMELCKNDHDMGILQLKSHHLKAKRITISKETIFTNENVQQSLRNNGIKHFPYILFNNKKIPREFNVTDLDLLLNDWNFSKG